LKSGLVDSGLEPGRVEEKIEKEKTGVTRRPGYNSLTFF
jgi:hypothetical protein